MYDELVMRLRCEECLPYNALRTMREAADAIEEMSKQLDDMNEAYIALYGALPKWIPVTEPYVRKRTNADRIRAMSDEELAGWLADHPVVSEYDENNPQHKAWLEWLRQEASDGKD